MRQVFILTAGDDVVYGIPAEYHSPLGRACVRLRQLMVVANVAGGSALREIRII